MAAELGMPYQNLINLLWAIHFPQVGATCCSAFGDLFDGATIAA
jgi:hypothetical protein